MVHITIFYLVILILLPYNVQSRQNEDQTMNTPSHKNRLADAVSPYLLAHADNPVDWYQWSDEAFSRAKAEDKPIFLSIGYNACHWCHVMEHESFENEAIAKLLNDNFISIKVDREERPDIDQIYMSAVQALTGSGGWPISVFMTPDKKPFFGGTYFPPTSIAGRPGFTEIITELARAWNEARHDIVSSADKIADHIAEGSRVSVPSRTIDKNVILSAAQTFYANFDQRHGGFGHAPKFPQGTNLSLLFRAWQLTADDVYRDAALFSLHKMAEGGIRDHLGGGFHRYSVDYRWLVPHFEKMLYDNALLVTPYLEAYQVSGDPFYLTVASDILRFLQNDMTDAGGGFYSTLDADSEGKEGKYYTWTKAEIRQVLGVEADWFCEYYGITDDGNFEHGLSILNLGEHSQKVRERINLRDDEFDNKLDELRAKLLTHRGKRVPPATDDKILSSWNGLAISAFAQAYQVTGDQCYLASARKAADFILNSMTDDDALYHSFRRGQLLKTELLEDYAYFIAGLIDLYQAGFDEHHLERAEKFTRRAVEIFSDGDIFYSSTADNADLIFRPRDLIDGATPSAASVMILNLLKLGAITGDRYYADRGKAALEAVSGLAAQVPQGTAALLIAGHFDLAGPVEIVVSGDDSEKMATFNRTVFSRYLPNKVVVGNTNGKPSNLPLLQGRQGLDELTYFFCLDNTCRLPVTDMATLVEELDRISPARR